MHTFSEKNVQFKELQYFSFLFLEDLTSLAFNIVNELCVIQICESKNQDIVNKLNVIHNSSW